MSTAQLTSKGQITIPVAVRNAMGLTTGDRIEFIQQSDGAWRVVAGTKSVAALKGIIAKPNKPATIEQMNQAIINAGAKAAKS